MVTEVPVSVVSGQNFLAYNLHNFASSPEFFGLFLCGNPFGFIIVLASCPNNPLFLYQTFTSYSLYLRTPEPPNPRTYRHCLLIATPMEEGTIPTASEPPPLPYSLHTRKKSIAFFWTIFVIDTLAQPLILYWCLWYLTDLSHNLGMPCMVEQLHPLMLLMWICSLLNRHCVTWRSLGL